MSLVPTIPGVLAPISNLPEGAVLPSAYIIHQHSQACENCGRVYEWSEVYAYNQLKTRTGAGKLVQNLTRVNGFLYNIPVARIPVAESFIPACFECAEVIDLSPLPKLQDTELWQAAVAKKKEQEEKAKTSSGTKAPPTTEALLDLI
jgi:hypothetical protein